MGKENNRAIGTETRAIAKCTGGGARRIGQGEKPPDDWNPALNQKEKKGSGEERRKSSRKKGFHGTGKI